ncbi:MAG: hypothetical protein R3E66_07910 [bacterium]
MSQAFLFTSWDSAQDFGRFLPFVPHDSSVQEFGCARLRRWTVRGSADASHSLVMDGWIEDKTALSGAITASAAHAVIRNSGGEFAVVNVAPDGHALAFCDFLGGRHIYYRQTGAKLAISNRALLVAAAFGAPEIEPAEMAWFMASIACPFTEKTAWRDVKILDAGAVMSWDGDLKLRPTPIEPADHPWEHLWESLCARVRGLAVSHATNRLAITGGLDSRLVFAAAIGSRSLGQFTHAYLRGHEDMADVKVARQIADHYNIPFELSSPELLTEPVETIIDRHNFQTECGLHCWDLKGLTTAPNVQSFHGNFGEIFRSHSLPRFVLGWPEVERKYLSENYLDLYDVMTPDAVQHVRAGIRTWLDEKKREGVPPLKLHDRMHRAARMHRWVGQTSQVDGFLGGSVNPIPSPKMLSRYLHLSLMNQKIHRTHFEMIRRADDWLWRQPFANDGWSRLIAPRWVQRPAPVRNGPMAKSRQMALWEREAGALADLVLGDDSSEFDQLFDRVRVERLVKSTQKNPTPHRVRAILGLAGIRRSLVAPSRRHVCTIEEAQ